MKLGMLNRAEESVAFLLREPNVAGDLEVVKMS
jgi:hypothetical protein